MIHRSSPLDTLALCTRAHSCAGQSIFSMNSPSALGIELQTSFAGELPGLMMYAYVAHFRRSQNQLIFITDYPPNVSDNREAELYNRYNSRQFSAMFALDIGKKCVEAVRKLLVEYLIYT
jgi:hypothetical protein